MKDSKVSYVYVDKRHYGVVWPNVFVFIILHVSCVYAAYMLFSQRAWNTWAFSYIIGSFGGLGVTAGAHRLWSHRSYKARLPLRIFLAACFTIAGQNDLLTWCRDHRVHHKYSETDADPHNSRRGFFFAHVGWLLTRKHPEVTSKGGKLDISDLENDPVVMYQKKFYLPLYLLLNVALPVIIPYMLWSENPGTAFLVSVLWRYVTSLHCTWFVNSAAHMWGDRPYRKNIQARENILVSFGAFGEGYHNYHHTFPNDYATSELGWKFNATKLFIDAMAMIGLVYDRTTYQQDKIDFIKTLNAQ
ncbi:stearoyl-CoA desaturase 2-like [Brevipalpus obovatus]|uniref:stearoyl-CoA desaturase 2-like n=1 Tax=Brevipalpus obovatus TaxID=246614 RepID=UPI003D9E47FE